MKNNPTNPISERNNKKRNKIMDESHFLICFSWNLAGVMFPMQIFVQVQVLGGCYYLPFSLLDFLFVLKLSFPTVRRHQAFSQVAIEIS